MKVVAFLLRLRGETPPLPVPGGWLDVVAQEEADIPPAIVQREDLRVKVVFVQMAGKDVQGDPRRNGRKFPFPPVEQQRGGTGLHQKATVLQKGDTHHFTFTAVP